MIIKQNATSLRNCSPTNGIVDVESVYIYSLLQAAQIAGPESPPNSFIALFDKSICPIVLKLLTVLSSGNASLVADDNNGSVSR